MPDGNNKYFVYDFKIAKDKEIFSSCPSLPIGHASIYEKTYHPLAVIMIELKKDPTAERLKTFMEYGDSDDVTPLEKCRIKYAMQLSEMPIDNVDAVLQNASIINRVSQAILDIDSLSDGEKSSTDEEREYLLSVYKIATQGISFVPVAKETEKTEDKVLSLGEVSPKIKF